MTTESNSDSTTQTAPGAIPFPPLAGDQHSTLCILHSAFIFDLPSSDPNFISPCL